MLKFKKTLALIFSSCIIFGFIGCGKESTEVIKLKQDEYNNEYFIGMNKFTSSMNDEDTIIIDARSQKDYEKSHIPGAINIQWQSLANMNRKAGEKDWGIVLGKEKLSKKLGELGIDKDSKIVVYANKDGWGEDGRIVWELKSAGLNAKMLEGGFDLWNIEGKKTTSEVPIVVSTSLKIEDIDSSTTITTEDLYKNMDKYIIVDSREKDEYDGATKFGEAKGGHIKGAISFPFNKVYNEDGTIKSKDELIKLFDESGFKKDKEIVTYCTAGIRSAHLALILNMLGYNAKNYDASFYEWATSYPKLVIK